ncbi:hypothetical protein [Roseospirillum parvum]|uniref:hypothetical protein n=1 Tax=Roseospirillum parvum TaxID=83401 RepID=UPI001C40BA23|nr:hypothetical protein [Roseospirillum parvum]
MIFLRGMVLCAMVFALGGMLPPTAAAQAPESSPSGAPDPQRLINQELIAEVRDWLSAETVFLVLEARNAEHANIGQAEIDALDQQWRAERESDDQPLIAAVLNGPLSTYLTQIQAASLGLFSEIFVVDTKGLNAGQSAITSDYWQGDEAKFQNTFPVGPDAVFIDEAELHEGSRTWRAQLNLTIARDQQAVGAATVEINLTELARRRALGL